MAKSREDLQELLTTVSNISASHRLLVIQKKTELMTIGKEQEDMVVTFEGKRIEQVTHFKYQDTITTESVECETEK